MVDEWREGKGGGLELVVASGVVSDKQYGDCRGSRTTHQRFTGHRSRQLKAIREWTRGAGGGVVTCGGFVGIRDSDRSTDRSRIFGDWGTVKTVK